MNNVGERGAVPIDTTEEIGLRFPADFRKPGLYMKQRAVSKADRHLNMLSGPLALGK